MNEPTEDFGNDLGRDLDKSTTATQPAPVAAVSPAKKSLQKRATLILASAGVLIVVILGWLGWSFWVDRQALTILNTDLIAARDQADESKSKTEESGETATARQLTSRTAEINDSPWWDRVAVRIIAQGEIDRATSEASELVSAAQRRTANRAWWAQRRIAAESALAVEERTMPTIQGVLDDLEDSQPPHPSDGGFTEGMVDQLRTSIQTDIANLTALQDKTIASLQAQETKITSAASLEDLAAMREELAKPLPIDRNPPELADAVAKIGEGAKTTEALLTARDALLSGLNATLTEIQKADVETTSTESMKKTRDLLISMRIDPDSRFDLSREIAAQCIQTADGTIVILTDRDAALTWIAAQSMALAEIDSLDEIAAYAKRITESDAPQSNLPLVTTAMRDLAARVGARAQVLAEEQRLLEESIARAALCTQALDEMNNMLERGRLATAADALLGAKPETDDQIAQVQQLKVEFQNLPVERLAAMSDQAATAGNWADVAGEFRQCLTSNSVRMLAPQFESDSSELWKKVQLAEDRMIYGDIQRLANSPLAELAPVAKWYLDPARTRGADCPMCPQVSTLMDALAHPSVTAQVEGIEWSSPNCAWDQPETVVEIVVDQTVHTFTLARVAEREMTPFGEEQTIEMSPESLVRFSVNGKFSCTDDDGVFKGSGIVPMDDLRIGGRFSLPFWNDGDQSLPPHRLLLISIPDEAVRKATSLPPWIDPRIPRVPDMPIAVPDVSPAETETEIPDPTVPR